MLLSMRNFANANKTSTDFPDTYGGVESEPVFRAPAKRKNGVGFGWKGRGQGTSLMLDTNSGTNGTVIEIIKSTTVASDYFPRVRDEDIELERVKKDPARAL
jgi:hypothetical protein